METRDDASMGEEKLRFAVGDSFTHAKDETGKVTHNVMNLDEKSFHAWKTGGKRKVPKGDEAPTDHVSSRPQVPNFVVVALAARTSPTHDFTGKVGVWRVTDLGEAARNFQETEEETNGLGRRQRGRRPVPTVLGGRHLPGRSKSDAVGRRDRDPDGRGHAPRRQGKPRH